MKCPKCHSRSKVIIKHYQPIRQCKRCEHQFDMETFKPRYNNFVINKWTDEELSKIVELNEKGFSYSDSAEFLGRKNGSIRNKINYLKNTKKYECIAERVEISEMSRV